MAHSDNPQSSLSLVCVYHHQSCTGCQLHCFLLAAGGWLTLSLSPSSADTSWHQEALPFPPAFNESEPAWGWEDEQGFSALRHSGRTRAPPAPAPSLRQPPACAQRPARPRFGMGGAGGASRRCPVFQVQIQLGRLLPHALLGWTR